MPSVPINWELVSANAPYIGLLSALVFLAALIGNLLAFRSRLLGAILTAILFAVFYIAWTYYLVPQGYIPAGMVPALKTGAP